MGDIPAGIRGSGMGVFPSADKAYSLRDKGTGDRSYIPSGDIGIIPSGQGIGVLSPQGI